MALTLGTDTFCEPDVADIYHSELPFNSEWFDVESLVREKYLRLSTRILSDTLLWTGTPALNTQKLAFPREGLKTKAGADVSVSEVPEVIQYATAELALQLYKNPALVEDQPVVDLDIRAVGDIAFGGDAIARRIPELVLDMLPDDWFEPPIGENIDSPDVIYLSRS